MHTAAEINAINEDLARPVTDPGERATILLSTAAGTLEGLEENFRMLAILLGDLLPLFKHASTESDRVKMALTWLEGCGEMAEMALEDVRSARGLIGADA